MTARDDVETVARVLAEQRMSLIGLTPDERTAVLDRRWPLFAEGATEVVSALSRSWVVTTEEELDALPDKSVILDAVDVVWCRRGGLWCEAGYAEGLESWEVADDAAGLPARILWSPSAVPACEGQFSEPEDVSRRSETDGPAGGQ